ncbi:DUF262 domain-containing HNH endonuclease family protein [Pedobacter sp. PLR]|uniref:DUF262 domain-containing protein n=1 Tax=Pedobacter sp. PLR TaxID=2994465 RepID=UPI002245DBC5|nr:DUF262 domain-containing HNH endonuclease family protein [Pedobacter sp. PLR]MCX2454344.1 DUF262 domain-containing HNH endonuclease family protein [Pedobacter sp. PLR]
MKNNKLDIDRYLKKGTYVVPNYQRGYKWPVKDKEGKSSLIFFIDSLTQAFDNELSEYFLEAVTVVEENGTVILVDGQQRTTTLFLLLAALGDVQSIQGKLRYDIRQDSHRFLNNLVEDVKVEIEDENTQDIFYFQEANKEIEKKIALLSCKDTFLTFLKKNVFLLYNTVPKSKAINTFIALNGLKAVMKEEELIKSELLIKSSRSVDQEYEEGDEASKLSLEWRVTEKRGILARNWDKWVSWWNQKEVKNYFVIDNKHPLHYLLLTYWNIHRSNGIKNKEFSFDNFKSEFLSADQKAISHFEGLRKLQKGFEDLYSNYEQHNYLGLILKTSNERSTPLCYFLDPKIKEKISLEAYAKWSLVRAKHREIIEDITEKEEGAEEVLVKSRKAIEAINLLDEQYIYCDEKDVKSSDRWNLACDFLAFLNIREDNRLKRKFDFSIWGDRSLEHIHPQSKKGELNFESPGCANGSVHCIGNLVLLYGFDNSKFSNKDFDDKKSIYFDTSISFTSRHLLHTVSVFAQPKWDADEIMSNKNKINAELINYYGFK